MRRTESADYVGTFKQHSPEWHAARASGIGGSDIAAVLGLSPWESRFSLWHRKAGTVGDQADNDEMSWGRYLEDPIAKWFANQHPELRTWRTGTWRNRDRPWQLANPDRFAAGRRVVEIKTDRYADGWGTEGTDEIPVYYRAQVLWYLDTLGWDYAHIAVLIGGSDPREYIVRYSLEEALFMRAEAEKFWASIAADEQPALDGSEATYRVVRELHPDIDGEDVEIPTELANRYRDALEGEKTAEDTKRHVAAELLTAMGTSRRAVSDGERIAIRVPGRGDNPPTLRPSPAKKTPGQKVSEAAT